MCEPKDRLCLALDVPNAGAAIGLARALIGSVGLFKIGSELFTSEGPSVVSAVREVGIEVFLDLKFHDIPNTVAGAARAATRLGVSMFNVHASGGRDMIRAAVEASREESDRLGRSPPRVLAVTVLTSLDDDRYQRDALGSLPVAEAVLRLAEMAVGAQADGLIASAKEVKALREAVGTDPLLVTPGIRPSWASVGDQRRVTTPREAVELGTDIIVIGRPIRDADDPAAAARKVLDELS